VTLLEAIILGLVQGLTEFLPISSSGHLVLAKEILGVSTQMDTHIGITFEVFVHFGTLLAIGTIFWNDILKLIKAFFSIFPILFSDQKFETRYCNNSYFRMMILIIAGSLPAGIIGLLLEDTIEEAFNNPVLVCIMLLLTGGILIASKFFLNGQKQLNASTALAIGFAQAVAIIPGISRSGSTICTGLMMGLEREESARFSFLLAVPVIAMATILKQLVLGVPYTGLQCPNRGTHPVNEHANGRERFRHWNEEDRTVPANRYFISPMYRRSSRRTSTWGHSEGRTSLRRILRLVLAELDRKIGDGINYRSDLAAPISLFCHVQTEIGTRSRGRVLNKPAPEMEL